MAATSDVVSTPRNGGNGHSRIILDWILKVAGPLALVLFGFLLNMLVAAEQRLTQHEVDLAGIQSNRFTAQDGSDIQRQIGTLVTREELASEIRGLRDDIREIRRLVRVVAEMDMGQGGQ